MSLLIGAIVSA